MEFLLYLSKALRECDEMAPKRLAEVLRRVENAEG